MAILGITEAQHFCKGYSATAGTPQGSFRQWTRSLPLRRTFLEGTPQFVEYRDISLREVERLLFLAASHYRRSFDLQMSSASPWAHVTLYYGAFFSAQALLGAFGTWKLKSDHIVDVEDGTPGSQRFAVKQYPTTYNGSHERFWDYFYASVVPLHIVTDPALRYALLPVSSNPVWQIQTRNDINYGTYEAIQLMSMFQKNFRPSRFRSTLPGVLNTQFIIMEGLLQLATRFAIENGISTDALNGLQPVGNRKVKMKHLVLAATRPNIERHIKRTAMR